MRLRWIFIIIILLMIIGVNYIYFFIVNPSFTNKPKIDKPNITNLDIESNASSEISKIETDHLRYIVNELDMYKLHKTPLTNDYPSIEFIVLDKNKIFNIIVKNNNIIVNEGSAEDPDLRIKGDEKYIIEILQSEDIKTKVVELVTVGKISLEVLKSEKDLALKGYLSLYKSLSGDKEHLTGQAVGIITKKNINSITSVIVMLNISLILILLFFLGTKELKTKDNKKIR